MVTVHLVRHARSAQDPNRPSWEWGLTPDAGVGATRLRANGVLPDGAHWVSSTEPKAMATAALLTDLDVATDDDLREALRDPAWLDLGEFQRLVLASFEQPDRSVRDGWEPLAATRDRVVHAATRAVADADGRDVVLVGHGTAWTMLVAGVTDRPPDIPGWGSMRMPDHCTLAWPDRLESVWGSWG